MEKSMIFVVVVLFLSAVFNLSAQEQTINIDDMEVKPVYYFLNSDKQQELSFGVRAVFMASTEKDSLESVTDFKYARVSSRIRYNQLSLYTSLKMSSSNFAAQDKEFVREIYLEFQEIFDIFSIKWGKIRLASDLISRFEDQRNVMNYPVGNPFLDQTGFGFQLDFKFNKNTRFVVDATTKFSGAVSKPDWYSDQVSFSGMVHYHEPYYYLDIKSGIQFSPDFVRLINFVRWNNPRSPFLIEGTIFNESNGNESFFSFNALTALKLGVFDIHTQVENGMLSYGGKRTFITSGAGLDFSFKDTQYKVSVDYRVPLGETNKDWRLFVNLALIINPS